MDDLSDKIALVWDRGSFLPFAQALGGEDGFGSVLYFSEWRAFAPLSKDTLIGRDMENVQRVDSFWDHLDEADVIVFPDVGDGDLQIYLRKLGKPVWGTARAEMLELDRANFKKLLETIDQPVIPWQQIIGMGDLEEFMRDPANDDSWIKSSFFRGDLETYHHQSWFLSESWFDDLKHRLGPHAKELDVIAEKGMTAIEYGYDGYNIDGKFPSRAMWGFERKDKLYLIKICDYSAMPESLQETNKALAATLKRLDCRGNYHSEVRLAEDGTAYLNDPCLRAGSPPHEVMSMLITNWPEIVWAGAHGDIVDPEETEDGPYGAQIILRSEWGDEHFVSVAVPNDVRDRVRFRRAIRWSGNYWHVPGSGLDLLGSALGFGNTPKEALREAEKVAERVKAYQLDFNHNALDDMMKTIREGEEKGVNF